MSMQLFAGSVRHRAALAVAAVSASGPIAGAGQGHAHRLSEIRQAGPAQEQGLARREARAARLQGRCGPSFRPARRCWKRSMSARSISAIPARRRRSSPRPQALRSSMSRTSRRAPPARRSWCRRTARSRSVADLKGKKVALNKGSNVHYLLVKALEKAGVKYTDIEPVFLAPADARAAFERGAVDAWVIWDPFQAAAEAATGARTLADGKGIVANQQFYLRRNEIRRRQSAGVLDALVEASREVDRLGEGRHQGGRRAAQPGDRHSGTGARRSRSSARRTASSRSTRRSSPSSRRIADTLPRARPDPRSRSTIVQRSSARRGS